MSKGRLHIILTALFHALVRNHMSSTMEMSHFILLIILYLYDNAYTFVESKSPLIKSSPDEGKHKMIKP